MNSPCWRLGIFEYCPFPVGAAVGGGPKIPDAGLIPSAVSMCCASPSANERRDRPKRESSVFLWFISMGMGLAFAAVGTMKLVASKKRLVLWGAGWINEFGPGTVRFVGLTEVVAGLTITLPPVMDIPPRLALSAGIAGLIVVMLGAAVIHARLREPGMIVLNVALLALAAVAFWGRPGY